MIISEKLTNTENYIPLYSDNTNTFSQDMRLDLESMLDIAINDIDTFNYLNASKPRSVTFYMILSS